MDITLDMGPEASMLLQKLANQIGVTVEQIFPWYVHQAQLEGIICLCVFSFFVLLATILIVVGTRGVKKYGVGHDHPNIPAICLIAGSMVSIGVLISMGALPETITKIANPNFHAMKMLAGDIARLRGK